MSWFKKNRTTILLVLAMIVGTALIAYPTFANWWNNIHQSRAVAAYVQSVEKMNTEDYDQVIREAEEYNRRLTETGILWTMTDDERAEYQRQLKIESTDIMGYIDIEKAKIHLPVYHGTEDSILQVAIERRFLSGEREHTVSSPDTGDCRQRDFSPILTSWRREIYSPSRCWIM